MTTGSRAVARSLLPVLYFVAAACPQFGAAAEPAEWGAEQLMRRLAGVKSSTARFTERKHLAILTAPLESSGTLVYTAPDRLEKHMLAPRRESLVLERDQLTLEDKERKQRRTVALPNTPVIWAFVEGIRSTLAGDLPTLNRYYQVGIEGGEQKWRLTLRPSDPKMLEFVSEIRIGGSHDRINTIEITESGGDRAVMTITKDGP